MKKVIQFLIVSLVVVLSPAKIFAQASVSASVFAEVIAALTATENAQMSFGKFSPGGNGGEIHLSPSGVRTVAGNIVLSGGNQSAGVFTITGDDQATYSINLPTTQTTLVSSTGNYTMVVSGWESIPPAGVGAGLLAGGTQDVKVGAVLYVGSMNMNPVGMYTGMYTITFAYN